MTEIRYVSPTGMLGSGFQEASFRRVLDANPHFVGCDAGSTDDGPSHLGSGSAMLSRDACKRDLRLLLRGTREKRIPLLIGSAGFGGGALNLAWAWDIVQEVAREEGLRFKAAVIQAEPEREVILAKYRAGRVRALANAPAIDERVLAEADHVVCMMGVEPFQEAIDNGADLVLAGRASDTSIFAALPVKAGLPPGLAWHAAKILECGAGAVVNRFTPDGMLCTMNEAGFTIEPANPAMRCSPASIASHSLYENGDPYLLHEPGGVLDTTHAVYEALDDRRVRVHGSNFRPMPYTVKLEGATRAGYQSVVLAGVRDPVIIGQLDDWLASMRQRITDRFDSIYGRDMSGEYHFNMRVYGRDGVMGAREPLRAQVGHEIGLLMDVLAATPEHAHTMASTAAHIGLHHPVPEWHGLISGLAFPYAPHVMDRGLVYKFILNHVMELDHPLEVFRIDYHQV